MRERAQNDCTLGAVAVAMPLRHNAWAIFLGKDEAGMPFFLRTLTRRSWIQAASAFSATAAANRLCAAPNPRPRIAAVFTELRFRSHAYNFLVNLMGRYSFRGQRVD